MSQYNYVPDCWDVLQGESADEDYGYPDEDDSTYGGGGSESGPIVRELPPVEWEHGRRYQAYTVHTYFYPNDEEEQQRLTSMHSFITSCLGYFSAPIQPETSKDFKVLDVGTGTGDWAIEMAYRYPNAVIRGIDLSDIQPEWVPPNVSFLVDDVELYAAEDENKISVDYVHCRSIGGGSIGNWRALIDNLYGCVKPGGWVEFRAFSTNFTSSDGEIPSGHAFLQLTDHLNEACNKAGRILDPTPELPLWLAVGGFTNVMKETTKFPIGKWPANKALREVGEQMSANIELAVGAMTAKLLRGEMNWRHDSVEMLNLEVRKAAKAFDLKLSLDYVQITAQKPISKNDVSSTIG